MINNLKLNSLGLQPINISATFRYFGTFSLLLFFIFSVGTCLLWSIGTLFFVIFGFTYQITLYSICLIADIHYMYYVTDINFIHDINFCLSDISVLIYRVSADMTIPCTVLDSTSELLIINGVENLANEQEFNIFSWIKEHKVIVIGVTTLIALISFFYYKNSNFEGVDVSKYISNWGDLEQNQLEIIDAFSSVGAYKTTMFYLEHIIESCIAYSDITVMLENMYYIFIECPQADSMLFTLMKYPHILQQLVYWFDNLRLMKLTVEQKMLFVELYPIFVDCLNNLNSI